MSQRRFFFPSDLRTGSFRELTEKEKHYLSCVLRLKEGDEVKLFDGRGKEGVGLLERVAAHRLGVRVFSVREEKERGFVLFLCQSLTKRGKMDLIVQKATELGVQKIIPVITRRSVSRPEEVEIGKRVSRWQRIAQEASRQSGRVFVPEISPVIEFPALLEGGYPADFLPLILWEERGADLREILGAENPKKYRGAMILVGPEGGFEEAEVEAAKERGFIPVWLGRLVLRAETAAIVICALVQFASGAFFAFSGHDGEGP